MIRGYQFFKLGYYTSKINTTYVLYLGKKSINLEKRIKTLDLKLKQSRPFDLRDLRSDLSREGDYKAASLSDLAFNLYFPAVHYYDVFYYTKTQSCAADLP